MITLFTIITDTWGIEHVPQENGSIVAPARDEFVIRAVHKCAHHLVAVGVRMTFEAGKHCARFPVDEHELR